MLERVPTGIPGFDELCEGGLLKGRSHLVSGISGSGKTIFAMQYLYNGATKFNESGIFVATKERPQHLREYFAIFGWDIEKLEDENVLAIINATLTKIGPSSDEKYINVMPFDTRSLLGQIIKIQDEIRAKRAVIDSTTSIGFFLGDIAKFRSELLKMCKIMNILSLTSILTCEVVECGEKISRFGIENFVTKSTIMLYYDRIMNTRVRSLEILKMEGTNYNKKIYPFDITKNGIVVYSKI